MYLIVGLGNPGKRYEHTRHNVGFDALDSLADYLNVKIDKIKFKGIYTETRFANKKIILLKPETYMNASGDSVVQCMNYYGIEPENVIVLVDDIDIQFGTVKIKKNGSAGTHNGLKSIIKMIGSSDFPRVKIGVNQKPEYMDLADFVLSRFDRKEQDTIDKEIELARDGVIDILENGIDYAMNRVNSIKVCE